MRPAPAANREAEAAPAIGLASPGAPPDRPSIDVAVRERAKRLLQDGDKLFSSRMPLLSLWQDIAEMFYVERADFTAGLNPGADFASHLTTGHPLMVRQELANAIAGMLRPPGRAWFKLVLKGRGGAAPSQAVAAWLEESGHRMRAAMYDRDAALQRATKQADNDYVSFGNAVISVEPNWRDTSLLYRNWHLRDTVWREDFAGRIDEVHRRAKFSAHDLIDLFPETCAQELYAMSPEERRARQIECRHIVVPSARYGDASIAAPYVSIHLDVEHDHVMEAVGRPTLGYVIPRWQLVGGSVYGYSPPAVASVADARMLQDMTRTILEAGEKAVDPPMVATQEAVRSDLALYPGGVTYVDAAYDERLGAALRPISHDSSGLPIGMEMQQDTRNQIAAAWMLNRLHLPTNGGGMTAYEVGQRVQEYIRQAIPLFEPIEAEYSGALCEETFRTLRAVGAFGRPEEWPEDLNTDAVAFAFENPFTSAGDGQALSQYEAVSALLAQQAALDPAAATEIEPRRMFRDAIKATGAPAAWLRDIETADEARGALMQERALLDGLAQLEAGGRAAHAVGAGAGALSEGVGAGVGDLLAAMGAEVGEADDAETLEAGDDEMEDEI